MGLFDRAKKASNDAKMRMDEAKSRLDDAKTSLETAAFSTKKAVGAVTGQEDVRPFVPPAIQQHRSNDCVEVKMCDRYQPVISTMQPGLVQVTLVKPYNGQPYDNYEGLLVVSNNCILGAIHDSTIKKYGWKAGHQAVCEVVYPQYRWEDHIQLYMRLSDADKAERDAKDALKLWINVDASKWGIEHGERFDFSSGEILTRSTDGKKPVYVVMGEGRKLFEVNSRMKNYVDIEQRASYPIRRLIAEFKNGDYGPYYHVGFYY